MIGFEDVRVRAGDFELRDIRFEVGAGAYAVLMGRTGSGKTTILETLCGLRRVAAALLIGYMLGVRIVRPLHYAIEIAALIARGKLDTVLAIHPSNVRNDRDDRPREEQQLPPFRKRFLASELIVDAAG